MGKLMVLDVPIVDYRLQKVTTFCSLYILRHYNGLQKVAAFDTFQNISGLESTQQNQEIDDSRNQEARKINQSWISNHFARCKPDANRFFFPTYSSLCTPTV
jgi:hypothetical protein